MLRHKLYFFVIGIALTISLAACGQKQEPVGFSVNGQRAETNNQSVSKVKGEAHKVMEEVKSTSAPVVKEVEQKVKGEFRPFPIYTDENSPDNHYFPSGWMGDFNDIRMDSAHLDSPHSGSTSIKIQYNNKASSGARWAGVYWQNPANNWGNRDGGYDLTGAKKLSFWARGEKGGERIEEVKVGGITGQYSDSDIAGIGPLRLTSEWTHYTINLEHKDLSSIIGGFAWAANLDNNPNGVTFYLDDIRFE